MLDKIKKKIVSIYGDDLVSLVAFGPSIRTNFEEKEVYLVIVTKNSEKKAELNFSPYKIFTIHKEPESIKIKNLWLKGAELKILYDKDKFFEDIIKKW